MTSPGPQNPKRWANGKVYSWHHFKHTLHSALDLEWICPGVLPMESESWESRNFRTVSRKPPEVHPEKLQPCLWMIATLTIIAPQTLTPFNKLLHDSSWSNNSNGQSNNGLSIPLYMHSLGNRQFCTHTSGLNELFPLSSNVLCAWGKVAESSLRTATSCWTGSFLKNSAKIELSCLQVGAPSAARASTLRAWLLPV